MSAGHAGSRRTLLLVTRNFPPMVGGLERYAEDLYRSLAECEPVDLLANGRGKWGLPLFLCQVLWHLLRHRHEHWHVHFADAALAPLACLVRRLTGTSVSITTHALDVVHPNPLYQRLVPRCLRSLDGVVCVSRFTREECLARGVAADRCRVIPNGIRYRDREVPGTPPGGAHLGAAMAGKRVLLTIGRLVRRKGVAWFTCNVMPRLGEEWVLLIGGGGMERGNIEKCIAAHGLQQRVQLLGAIDEQQKQALLAQADLFVMPNLSVPGDAEGFGIAVIEATASGVPVIASGVEGLRDAVVDGITGRLVPERDVASWLDAIATTALDRQSIAAATRERFDWSILAREYLDYFHALARH